jgi:hypothetical protein
VKIRPCDQRGARDRDEDEEESRDAAGAHVCMLQFGRVGQVGWVSQIRGHGPACIS